MDEFGNVPVDISPEAINRLLESIKKISADPEMKMVHKTVKKIREHVDKLEFKYILDSNEHEATTKLSEVQKEDDG